MTAKPADGMPYSAVSCYAFSELSDSLQDEYFETYIRNSTRGMIISNAAVFSKSIGGRNDMDLESWFQSEGLPVIVQTSSDLHGPADLACNVSLIHWNRR